MIQSWSTNRAQRAFGSATYIAHFHSIIVCCDYLLRGTEIENLYPKCTHHSAMVPFSPLSPLMESISYVLSIPLIVRSRLAPP